MNDTVTASMIKNLIAEQDAQRPRSQQAHIGPSGIGVPCSRRIGYQIAGIAPVQRRGLALAPWIGTAAHAAMAEAIAGNPDWISELAVTLPGTTGIGGRPEPISGTLDAYHIPSRTIVDWKFVADTTIAKTRSKGTPDDTYRTQVHLYAYGLSYAGHRVDTVAVAYIPRSGRAENVHVWSEPYEEKLALTALDRLAKIARIAQAGLVGTLPTADHWCESCPWWMPAATNPDDACPGHD